MEALAAMIIATIDVGTNTALLLVAKVDAQGAMTPLHEVERFIRLGEGVDATGRITGAAMHRLCAALLAYRALAERYGAAHIHIGATSASRDAENQTDLVDVVRRETGLAYGILSGEEEAVLSFRGAVSAFDDLSGPCAVIDIGGGSTELVVGEAEGEVAFRCSLDVGSVRLTERFFAEQPPSPRAVEKADAFVRRVLGSVDAPLDDGIPLIGAAGTAVALALVHHGAGSWSEMGVPHATLSAADVHAWRERLLAMAFDAVQALNPAVMQGRADVFAAGVLLLDAVLRRYGLPACRVSPRSLRHGLALRFAQATSRGLPGAPS